MNGRERLMAAMRGEAVDRVPIWLREGFGLYEDLPGQDDFRDDWKHDTVYQDLAEYVEPYIDYFVPYETPFVEECRKHNIPVNIHCHGKVRHALRCMTEMGVDSTDPVEPPPAGDLNFREAREISRGEVTLRGNLEYSEFTHLTPSRMKTRVRDILSDGNRRVILSTSAGPNTYINNHIADNYRAFVDAALEYGS